MFKNIFFFFQECGGSGNTIKGADPLDNEPIPIYVYSQYMYVYMHIFQPEPQFNSDYAALNGEEEEEPMI